MSIDHVVFRLEWPSRFWMTRIFGPGAGGYKGVAKDVGGDFLGGFCLAYSIIESPCKSDSWRWWRVCSLTVFRHRGVPHRCNHWCDKPGALGYFSSQQHVQKHLLEPSARSISRSSLITLICAFSSGRIDLQNGTVRSFFPAVNGKDIDVEIETSHPYKLKSSNSCSYKEQYSITRL